MRWRTHQKDAATSAAPRVQTASDSQACMVQNWLAGWAVTTSWRPSWSAHWRKAPSALVRVRLQASDRMRSAAPAGMTRPLRSGMLQAPHPMVEGTTDTDYYRGAVTASTPAQAAWVSEHRPDDPTLPGGAGLDAANVPGETAAVMAATVAAATKQGKR